MSPTITTISQILAIFTIAGQVGTLILILALFRQKKSSWAEKLLETVRAWWRPISFIIVLGAFFGSLFYSEIAGFSPCSLCWYLRIFIYPQIILLRGALLWRD